MLWGLGVPDLLGTNSTFFYLASDLAADGKGDPGGGRLVALRVTGEAARADVRGPADPRGGGRPALSIPVRLLVDRERDAVTIDFAGRETRVGRGGWSPWLAFRVPVVAPLGLPLVALDGLCRFHVLSIDPLRVYLSPLNYAPAHPFAPISAPAAFAGDLARALGPYKTVGWSEDTSALNAERVDEQAFLDDLDQTMDEVRASTLRELGRPDWDLLVSVFTQTDRVAHMFYRFLDPAHPRYDAVLAARFGDAVLRVYQRMDAIVGEVLARLGPEATLLVVSDHGFHSYRTGLNVNTWLRDHGYLVQGPLAPGEGYRTAWRPPLGAIPGDLFEPNLKKWSGDHAASDVVDTPGVILASRRLGAADPAIVDLAPTALAFFGVPVPAEMEGHALLAAPQ